MTSETGGPLADGRPSYLFLFARDFQRLVAFYRDAVGLPLLYFEEGRFAFLAVGDGGFQIAIYPGRESPVEEKPHWFPVFDVDDLDTTVATLRTRGVDVGDVEPVPAGRAATFRDPEGNLVELHERP